MYRRGSIELARGVVTIVAFCAFQNNALGQAGVEQHRVITAGPATLQVLVRGQGDPIIFIASRGRGVEDFDNVSDRLVQAGYQTILPQPRGIGSSTGPLEGITYHDLAADVAATIRELVSGPAVVIGHGFGTRVARVLAKDYPTLVRHLILIAVPGPVTRSAQAVQATDRVFNPALPMEDRLKAIQESFFAKGNDARVWQEGWYLDAAEAQRAMDARTPLAEWWAGGSARILALQGVEDAVALPENARRLAEEFPDRVTLVEIPHAGHAMLPEQPQRIAEAILAYLR